jgi:radical SAM protein with 4Fe4S-binding SPASM domain
MQKIKFRFTGTHTDAFNKPGVLKLVFLDLTNHCNLRCRYCYNQDNLERSASNLPIELLEKVLESKVTREVTNWFFSGGEPLYYPYLDDALALFQRYGHRPKIATNGTALDPEVVDGWVSLGVQSVQFSLDTLDAAVFAGLNRGTEADHRRILENLEYAVRSPLRVVVSSVLTRDNITDVGEIMQYCHGLGVDSYTLYPNVPATKKDLDLVVSLPQQVKVFEELLARYRDISDTQIVDVTIPCIQFSDLYAHWKKRVAFRLHPCGAGQFNLKITSEGRVSTCICQDAEDFIVGDINESTIDEIWSSTEIEKFRSLSQTIPKCSTCQLQAACRGGCRNAGYVFGNEGILSPDPLCEFFRG